MSPSHTLRAAFLFAGTLAIATALAVTLRSASDEAPHAAVLQPPELHDAAATTGPTARPSASVGHRALPFTIERNGDGGIGPSVAVLVDRQWPERAIGATPIVLTDDFVMEVATGGCLDGRDVTTLVRGGESHHAFRQAIDDGEGGLVGLCRELSFAVSDEELARLVARLARARFLSLATTYDDRDVKDGTQWIVHLHFGGHDKYVYASNAFPAGLVDVVRFVVDAMLGPHVATARSKAIACADMPQHLEDAHTRYARASCVDGGPEGACVPVTPPP